MSGLDLAMCQGCSLMATLAEALAGRVVCVRPDCPLAPVVWSWAVSLRCINAVTAEGSTIRVQVSQPVLCRPVRVGGMVFDERVAQISLKLGR